MLRHRNSKKFSRGALGVAAFLVLVGLMAYCSEVRAADSGFSYEAGYFTVGSEPCMAGVGLSQELGDRWQFGAILHDEGTCDLAGFPFRVRPNLGLTISRVFRWRRWQVDIGPSIWEHGDVGIGDDQNCVSPGWADNAATVPLPYECPDGDVQLAFHLRIQWWISRNLFIALPHYSSGRSAPRNKGKNALVIGWRFR